MLSQVVIHSRCIPLFGLNHRATFTFSCRNFPFSFKVFSRGKCFWKLKSPRWPVCNFQLSLAKVHRFNILFKLSRLRVIRFSWKRKPFFGAYVFVPHLDLISFPQFLSLLLKGNDCWLSRSYDLKIHEAVFLKKVLELWNAWGVVGG